MKATVSKCLAIEIFKEARVLSGNNFLDNLVRGVSVLEGFEVFDNNYFIQPNEIVISSLFVREAKEAEKISIINKLSELKAAALVLICDLEKEILSDKIVNHADEKNLPIITLDRNIKHGDVIKEIMGNIVYSDNYENRLISNTIYDLLNFEKHTNFQRAIREAALNNNFQIIILNEDFNTVLAVETQHNATIQDAINLGKKAEMDKNSIYKMINVKGVQTYWGSVNIAEEKYFMFIVDNEDFYTAVEMTKLAEIIELAMGMWRYTPERDSKAEFIKALRRGDRSLAYILKDDAKIQSENILTVFYARGICNKSCNDVLSSIEEDSKLDLIKIREKEEIYGLVLCNSDEDEDILMEKRGKVIKWYNSLKENKEARIFHVTGLNGVEGAADGYKLISETWGFVGNVFPYKRAFTKYDLALVSNCINIQNQGGVVKKNFLELLSSFKGIKEGKEIKGNKERQLLETLETFVLDAGMNSGKTSEFMGIHTNTVQYRLKKINELLDVEITGNRVIPGLTIALALIRLERALDS